jgi:hypothetical protein
MKDVVSYNESSYAERFRPLSTKVSGFETNKQDAHLHIETPSISLSHPCPATPIQDEPWKTPDSTRITIMKPQSLTILCLIGIFGLASCSKPTVSVPSNEPGASPGDHILLQTELPAEIISGTPKDLAIPNLDKSKQSPIKIPQSSAIISKGKPVACSDKADPFEGEIAFVTDGEKDGNEGFSVIIGEGPHWIQVDLGASHFVDAVVLWHFFKNDRVVNDVIVQASDDPEFKTGVTTLFNNDSDNTSGQGIGNDRPYIGYHTGRQIPGNGTKARYVRTWSNGSTDNKMNEFIEIEVWGRPEE